MQLLSREAELELLETIDSHLKKRCELEKELLERLDLIPTAEVEEKLQVSSTTLRRWENNGLKRYQPPFENSKKVYYRASDLYKFLTVD